MASTQVTFTLSIDSSLVDTVTTALCSLSGWQAEVPDPTTGEMVPNSISPEDGAKQAVINFILNQVQEYSNRIALQGVTPPDNSLIS